MNIEHAYFLNGLIQEIVVMWLSQEVEYRQSSYYNGYMLFIIKLHLLVDHLKSLCGPDMAQG